MSKQDENAYVCFAAADDEDTEVEETDEEDYRRRAEYEERTGCGVVGGWKGKGVGCTFEDEDSNKSAAIMAMVGPPPPFPDVVPRRFRADSDLRMQRRRDAAVCLLHRCQRQQHGEGEEDKVQAASASSSGVQASMTLIPPRWRFEREPAGGACVLLRRSRSSGRLVLSPVDAHDVAALAH